MKRWRGLADLVVDAVEHGSMGVERVHQWTARKPFEIAALVPPLARPARAIAVAQGIAIAAVYATIRQVSRLAGAAIGIGLEAAERRRPKDEPPAAGAPPASGRDPSKRDQLM